MANPLIKLGVEVAATSRKKIISGRNIALVAHPASVNARFEHTLDVLLAAGARVERLFGPEHGFGGEAQDMEPVDGNARGPHGISLHSLYGADDSTLSPPIELLEGIDAMVVDLQDVGARYYTFAWTAVLCLRACHRAGVEMILLDRPNPLGGLEVEGAPQEPGFLSFVGLKPVANRHGLTMGELTRFAADAEGLSDALTVVAMEGWRREMLFGDTGLPWVMPSPNMPTFDTALVYPGGCLLEATWASEGRGTTRPFELFGAPGISGEALARALARMSLPGVAFRPTTFKPSFQKHAGLVCGGVQIHVTDTRAFKPYLTGVGALLALREVAGDLFEWRAAPYEFVSDIPAIDLLSGSSSLRELVERAAPLEEIARTWRNGELDFVQSKRNKHLY